MGVTKKASSTSDQVQAAKSNRWNIVLQIVLIPLILALITAGITLYTEEAKIKQEYVHIAVEILSQKVDQGTDQEEAPPLRRWATRILNESASVKLSPEDCEDLISGKARTRSLVSGNSAYLTDPKGDKITDENGHPIMVEQAQSASPDN